MNTKKEYQISCNKVRMVYKTVQTVLQIGRIIQSRLAFSSGFIHFKYIRYLRILQTNLPMFKFSNMLRQIKTKIIFIQSTRHNCSRDNNIFHLQCFFISSTFSMSYFFRYQLIQLFFTLYLFFLINNIFNNIRMKKNAKLLPQLNQLFLQRQSYSSHKKKILQIKSKKPRPKIQEEVHMLSRTPSRETSIRQSSLGIKKTNNKIEMKAIPPVILQKYHSLGNSFDWMSPYDKKKLAEGKKQYSRLRSRINSSKSQLDKIKLEKQYQKFSKIKERLMKYKVNPQSNKSVLKCEISLNLLSPKSRVSIVSEQNSKNDQKDKKRGFEFASRKQSNFSAFVKKTCEIKSENEHKKSLLLEKQRPQINYSRMEKNLQDYEKRYDRRLKTEFSKQKLQKLKPNKIINPPLNFRYFNLTQIDI